MYGERGGKDVFCCSFHKSPLLLVTYHGQEDFIGGEMTGFSTNVDATEK